MFQVNSGVLHTLSYDVLSAPDVTLDQSVCRGPITGEPEMKPQTPETRGLIAFICLLKQKNMLM